MKRRLKIPVIAVGVIVALGVGVYLDYVMQGDVIRIGIEWELVAYDAEGRLIARWHIREVLPLRWFLITDTGFDNLIRKAVGQSAGQPPGAQYVAIATGTSCTTASTALTGEVSRVLATYSEPAAKQFRQTATFSSVGGIQSAGAFNAAVGGVLLSCQTFPSITADTLEVRITYTLS